MNQPLAIKAVNRAGSWAGRIGVRPGPLDAERLMHKAVHRSNLSDFGDEGFFAGLSMLVEALNSEARLSTIGRIGAGAAIVDFLVIRLRLIAYRKQRPEIASEPIERPLFVLGLPRTGTTIVYELLAQDPKHRAPLSWEVDQPFPPGRAETFEGDPRIEIVRKRFEQIERLAPGFQAVHAIGPRLPQECVAMLASNFMSDQWALMYFVPSYRQWLATQSMAGAYRWHRRFLQHMQADYRRPRWVLKAPAHLGCIDAIVREYPNAAIVQMHRDPLVVIASFSSLVCTLHSAFSDEIDPVGTAAHEVEHLGKLLKAGMQQRAEIEAREGPGRFFDISFDELLASPIDAIERMYAHFKFEWSAGIRSKMQHYMDGRPRDKYGKHEYTLEEFGLDRSRYAPLFSDYCRKFGLSSGGESIKVSKRERYQP